LAVQNPTHAIDRHSNDSTLPILGFFLEDDTPTFRRTAVVHFIHWFSKYSSVDLCFRQLLIAANVVDLIDSALLAGKVNFSSIVILLTLRTDSIYPLDPDDTFASLYRQEVLSWAKEVFKTSYKVVDLPMLKYNL